MRAERSQLTTPSPLDETLKRLEATDANDDYLERIKRYLEFAKDCGFTSQAIVDSCIDLAETYTTVHEVATMRQHKHDAWNTARQAALIVQRGPLEIAMQLDPVYFEAVLRGVKTYEGRAYKPGSDKAYAGIRAYDRIRFRLSDRQPEFAADAASRGLGVEMDMLCTVSAVHFAPTVHGMYQIPRFSGLGFQPMLTGPSESIQLQRAAVYHTFPGYHELISEHGFLGLQVENPRLVPVCFKPSI